MSRFFKLTTLARSAVLALALGGAALSAATPVQAAQAHIDLRFGNGGGYSGVHSGADKYCLSDRQVRVLLRHNGYSDIRFIDRRGRIVGVKAERHNRDYRVWVD